MGRAKAALKRVLALLRRAVRFIKSLISALRFLYIRSPDYYESAHRILCQRAIQDENVNIQAQTAAIAAGATAALAPTAMRAPTVPPVAAHLAASSQQQLQQPQSTAQMPSRDKSPSIQARRLLFGSAAATTPFASAAAAQGLFSPKRAGSFNQGPNSSSLLAPGGGIGGPSLRRASDGPEGPALALRVNTARLGAYGSASAGGSGASAGGGASSTMQSPSQSLASSMQSSPSSARTTTAASAASAVPPLYPGGVARASSEHTPARPVAPAAAVPSPLSSRTDSGADSDDDARNTQQHQPAGRTTASDNARSAVLRNRVAAKFDEEPPPPQWH